MPGTDRLPAVILMHSAGAIKPGHRSMGTEIDDMGVAALFVDSFWVRLHLAISQSWILCL